MTESTGPLAGLSVLDLSTCPAGAMTSMLLSDSGADVLRIEAGETPEVDPVAYRVWHRGKRSIALDLRSSGHREILRKLAAAADVLIESFPPAKAASTPAPSWPNSAMTPRRWHPSRNPVPFWRPEPPPARRRYAHVP